MYVDVNSKIMLVVTPSINSLVRIRRVINAPRTASASCHEPIDPTSSGAPDYLHTTTTCMYCTCTHLPYLTLPYLTYLTVCLYAYTRLHMPHCLSCILQPNARGMLD